MVAEVLGLVVRGLHKTHVRGQRLLGCLWILYTMLRRQERVGAPRWCGSVGGQLQGAECSTHASGCVGSLCILVASWGAFIE